MIVSMPDLDGSPRPIQLWWTDTSDADEHVDRLHGVLDADESARARRFRVAEDRRRFAAAHIMLRCVLSREISVAPREVRFTVGSRGKPALDGPRDVTAPHFNLSHSEEIAVVATASSQIGVDVESIGRRTDPHRLAERYFSDAERSWLATRSGAAHTEGFFRIWTAKEAYLKAVGSGIAMPLRTVEVDPEIPALARIANDPGAAAEWTIKRVALPVAAECAVAIRGHGWSVRIRRFPWSDW
jgi:4'-phosphopantetheinyl transferase